MLSVHFVIDTLYNNTRPSCDCKGPCEGFISKWYKYNWLQRHLSVTDGFVLRDVVCCFRSPKKMTVKNCLHLFLRAAGPVAGLSSWHLFISKAQRSKSLQHHMWHKKNGGKSENMIRRDRSGGNTHNMQGNKIIKKEACFNLWKVSNASTIITVSSESFSFF